MNTGKYITVNPDSATIIKSHKMKNQKSLSLIAMFEEINSFMERNLEKWNSIEEIRRTYDEFINNLKKIKELQPELERDLSPVRKELQERRDLLLQKIFPIGNILEVYVEDHKPGKKAMSLIINHKKIESFGNKKLLTHSERLSKLIIKYMHRTENSEQDIKRYGLTQSMLDELNSTCKEFISSFQLLEDVESYRNRTRQKRDVLISTNRKLLKKRMNKLMTVFSGTHSSFYREYAGITKVK
jgi:hypothetical protein